MKAVIQRVGQSSLTVKGELISEIKGGLVVYFGVAVGDTREKAEYMAKKIANMRIFEDSNGKMNLSVIDKGLEILSVSQFTLLADSSHGNRPGFSNAEKPDIANELYTYFCDQLSKYNVPVKRGVFGADMKIAQLNDGPVTILLEA